MGLETGKPRNLIFISLLLVILSGFPASRFSILC
jgi:hypothetical protein